MAWLEPPELCWERVVAHLSLETAPGVAQLTAAAAFLALLHESLMANGVAQAPCIA